MSGGLLGPTDSTERSSLLGTQDFCGHVEDNLGGAEENEPLAHRWIGPWHGSLASPIHESHQGLTGRALLLAAVVGVTASMINTYFAIRDGSVSGFPLPTAFVVTSLGWTRNEILFVVVMVGQIAAMPMVAGFSGIMPALQYLTTVEERDRLDLAWYGPVFWTLGVCFFGSLWAMVIRNRFLPQEGLRFPSAQAIATMVRTTEGQNREPNPDRGILSVERRNSIQEPVASQETSRARESNIGQATFLDQPDTHHTGSSDRHPRSLVNRGNIRTEHRSTKSMKTLFWCSSAWAVMINVCPHLHDLSYSFLWENGWSVDLAPGYIGQGMVAGPKIAFGMTVGALSGWAILSRIVQSRKWVSGDVLDWEHGVRGWTVWPALTALLTDSITNLAWLLSEPLLGQLRGPRRLWNAAKWRACRLSSSDLHKPIQSDLLSPDRSLECSPAQMTEGEHSSTTFLNHYGYLCLGLFVGIVWCGIVVRNLVASFMDWWMIGLATLTGLALSPMSIQATGKTDYTPASALGKVSQLLFAKLVPKSNPDAVLINLIAGGIAEAAIVQAAGLTFQLKVGQLLDVPLLEIFSSHLLGTIIGAVFAPLWYSVMTHIFPIGTSGNDIPTAHLWEQAARRLLSRGLPQGASGWILITTLVFVVLAVAKIAIAEVSEEESGLREIVTWVPSGASFAMGMYNLPKVAISWLIGGFINLGYGGGHGSHLHVMLWGAVLMLGDATGAPVWKLLDLLFPSLKGIVPWCSVGRPVKVMDGT